MLRPPKGAKLTVAQDGRLRELESRLAGVGDVEEVHTRVVGGLHDLGSDTLIELKRKRRTDARNRAAIQRPSTHT